MTFRAILDDGKEHKPVLRMMTGEMTCRQVDNEYRGAVGKCPDCEGFLASSDLEGGGTFAMAVANKDRSVTYRRGIYVGGTDELLTQMHFKHAAGYLQGGLAPCNCKSRNQLIHKEAVEAIAHQYRKDSPEGFKVDAECQFVKPGTPPEMYRPDIVVHNRFGGKHTCIEYQRSPEPFDKFVHRHELRGSEWGSVIWFFDKKIWERKSTCEARDWLFDNKQTFYLCWVDEFTLQLQVEEGTFATAVVKVASKKKLRKFVPKACSTADIINEYLLATGQETDSRSERKRENPEPKKADWLKGFNLVEKSETDRKKNRELFETLKRQKAEQEEDERRRREWHTKMLQAEAERREHLRIEEEKQQRLRDQQEAKRREEEAKRREEQEVVDAAYRAKQQRLAEERQAQWERENAELFERQQQHLEAERHWHPIEFSEPIGRNGYRMTMNLMIGNRIRPRTGRSSEIYEGRSNAGYQTDAHTYLKLEGWEVWKEAKLDA